MSSLDQQSSTDQSPSKSPTHKETSHNTPRKVFQFLSSPAKATGNGVYFPFTPEMSLLASGASAVLMFMGVDGVGIKESLIKTCKEHSVYIS